MSISQTPRKILFVTRPLSPPWDEASKNFAFDLACNASANITILTDNLLSDLPTHITQKQIYSANHFSLWQKIRLVWFLLYHTSEYDIVHLLFTPTLFNSAMLRKILRQTTIIQTIATVRDDLYSPKELHNMFFGDVLVTYSLWAKEKLESLGFVHVIQIYPGIDLTKYAPKEKNIDLMEMWKLSTDHTVITYPGEYMRLGATDLIVDTFLELWKDPANHHIRYLCACRIKNDADALKKQEVINTFTDAGHIDKVIFTDTYGDMNAIYNLSDIVIFPVTNMQGKFDVPLAMIEPYACKKPVIASDLPLFKEFSSPQINVIIPASQKSALADAIIAVMNDPTRRHELGEHAYIFAHNTFNIAHIASKYTTLYEKI